MYINKVFFNAGDVKLSHINDVNLNDTVLAFGENGPRSIAGKVEWDAKMSVPQRMELETINNYNFTDVYERGLMTDTDSIIEGNIVSNSSHSFFQVLKKRLHQVSFVVKGKLLTLLDPPEPECSRDNDQNPLSQMLYSYKTI